MASQMIVAPSKDTLFMRGFSSRKDVEDIRDFFEKEARSKVLIEFLKQTDTDDRLYVALKFESKDVAKEILNRYDNTDVLGDRITLSWFKDLRRARAKVADRDRRSRYDSYDRGYDHRYDRRYDQRRMDNRNRVKPRRYLERSISRSPSYSRSRSRSRDRRDHSRSTSPPPKHKLKSAVEVQSSGKQKADDSDNERSSPLKDSSVSPRAYSPDPHSSDDDDDGGKDSKGKKDHHDDDDPTETPSGRYKRTSSYDDGHYTEDKYSRPQQGKSQPPARYTGEFEERELLESRWTRNNPMDPSPDVSDRASASRERERSGMEMGHGGADQYGRGGAGAGGEERRRMYEYEGGAWEGQPRRTVYADSAQRATEADRWLGIEGPQGVGRWPGGQKEGERLSGWSTQAMSMIQEKKEDIERVYKNDCETFVGVVKMLISKDPLLEERLQQSLRENLKDIGQRCILELREFIDRLREKEESSQLVGI